MVSALRLYWSVAPRPLKLPEGPDNNSSAGSAGLLVRVGLRAPARHREPSRSGEAGGSAANEKITMDN